MDISSSASCYILDGFNSVSSAEGSINGVAHQKVQSSRDLWDTRSVKAFVGAVKLFLSVPSKTTQLCRHRKNGRLNNAWFVFLVIFVTLVGIADMIKSVERFENRISSLEFTAIAVTIYRIYYLIKNMFALGKLYVARERVSHLFLTINKFCSPPHETTAFNAKVRHKLCILAPLLGFAGFLAIGVIMLACYACFSGIVMKKLAQDPNGCGWTCGSTYPVFHWAPIWGTFLGYFVAFFFQVGTDVFPQLLVILLMYPLGLRFGHFAESIKNLVAHTGGAHRSVDSPLAYHDAALTSTILRRQTAFHLELTKVVIELDSVSSFLFLIMYTGDLMGFITTASLVLHHKSSITSGSIDIELIPVFLSLVSVSTLLAILRTCFGVWLSEKAHSVLPSLYELNLKVTSEGDKFLCSSFISRLQGSRVALTAGGFFYITREFVITMFGVLLTYILFVYQMQDQKQDMSLLPKLEEITAAAMKLMENRTPSQLARYSINNCTM
ncbi:hypothetical protein BV898_16326 [Hypsibius exemplaris]|uniref:Gustatory receptor n=1 Tax=Hypsibius exemplaris TaxID=2072580 RepID=A0A9X6NLR9_HYPEX|nr:hypothetical protein BV898_16326 [Hypsibius exemplaris]